jgi:hypothetical protein
MMAASTIKEAIRSGDVDAPDEEILEELGFNANSIVGDDDLKIQFSIIFTCSWGQLSCTVNPEIFV